MAKKKKQSSYDRRMPSWQQIVFIVIGIIIILSMVIGLLINI
jgi:hypothetical protein